MMILYVTGSLFQSPAQVLVNTVNMVGVMGKGVALEFKRLFPEMFAEYRELCERGEFQIGKLHLYNKNRNKWVLNFPTKKHWRNPSRIEYIEAGLEVFVRHYTKMGIHSIAFPALGCGNGQLDFKNQVQPLMHKYLHRLPIDIFIYPDRQSDQFIRPEHENPEEMKRWLRSEPTSLPFSEVWDDLTKLLSRKNNFKTIAKGGSFVAGVNTEGIEISLTSGKRNIPYETLLAFWQQLRTHGFSMRHIAPDINRDVSYLMPIFAKLDYVKPIRVADSYANFHSRPVIGLQVLPSAFSGQSQPVQPPLFELS